jgi:hypothetical protein
MVAYSWRSLEIEKSQRVDLRWRGSGLEQFAAFLNSSFWAPYHRNLPPSCATLPANEWRSDAEQQPDNVFC